jgi:hypothetical protein
MAENELRKKGFMARGCSAFQRASRRLFPINRQRWSTHSFERIASGGVLAT